MCLYPMWHKFPFLRTEVVKRKVVGLQAIETDMCGVTLAIVMELCRLGSFYKLIEQARRVAHLPVEVRTGARCPSTPDMAKAKVTLHVDDVCCNVDCGSSLLIGGETDAAGAIDSIE